MDWRERDSLNCDVEVELEPAAAFDKFRRDLFWWWPREYSWSGAVLEDMVLEGRKGGFCWEKGPFGFRCDWGRVLRWVPPDRIVIAWHISPSRVPEPDPAKASEVELRFVPLDGKRTRLELEHRNFAAHGEGHDAYRNAMAAEKGWPHILRSFAAYCGRGRIPKTGAAA